MTYSHSLAHNGRTTTVTWQKNLDIVFVYDIIESAIDKSRGKITLASYCTFNSLPDKKPQLIGRVECDSKFQAYRAIVIHHRYSGKEIAYPTPRENDARDVRFIVIKGGKKD